MPIKKPWRVACSPNSCLPKYLDKLCDGSHKHVHCAGAYTLSTQSYTPEIVKQVHVSLNIDLNPKVKHPRWGEGAFICIELPVSDLDLECFEATALCATPSSHQHGTPQREGAVPAAVAPAACSTLQREGSFPAVVASVACGVQLGTSHGAQSPDLEYTVSWCRDAADSPEDQHSEEIVDELNLTSS